MSKKPYIVQQDSPNLVIVPTDGADSYEPSPKKVKIVSVPLPISNNLYNTVFSTKSTPKLNFNGRNNDVLIDVTKVQRPTTSWATNFLQSIGGSSTKFTRIYTSMPKAPLSLRKNRPPNDTEIALPNTNEIVCETKTNTAMSQPTIEEKSRATKINMDLIKSALQSTMTKETSQTKSSTHYYKPKCDTTSQWHLSKVPSLPKNYKIPMQSKHNKPGNNSVMNQEIISPLIIDNTCQKSQPSISTSKSNTDTFRLKHIEYTIQDTSANKLIHPITNNDLDQPKHASIKKAQVEKKREKIMINNEDTDQLKHVHENNHPKTKKMKIRHSSENHSSKTKYGQDIPLKTSIEAIQPIKNKENSQPKHNKKIKQHKATKETSLPKSNKDSSLPTYTKDLTCLKIKENVARSKIIKESYKSENKQHPTFSTKLKTKKEHISVKSKNCKTTKHIQENVPKKCKDRGLVNEENDLPQTLLKTEDIVAKLKKKRTAEKICGKSEYSDTVIKKPRKSDSKKDKSTSITEERLSKSISPMKSVVSKIKSDCHNHTSEKRHPKESGYYDSEKRHPKESGYYDSHLENESCTDSNYHCLNTEKTGSDVDLRTKIKRKVTKNNKSKEHYNNLTPQAHRYKQNTFATVAKGDPFVPDENLIISFNTEDDTVVDEGKEENVTMKKSPVKKMARKQPSGGNKCKKIKLEINIVFDQTDTSDDESTKSKDEVNEETLDNMDLSFLDDFNVDEIVESLNECKDSYSPVNKEERLTVAKATQQVQDSLCNEKIDKIDTMDVEDAVLLNKNGIRTETLPCCLNEISSVDNEIENHQEVSLQSAVNIERPCYREEIQRSINSNTTAIKTENEEFEADPNIPQTKTSNDPKVRISPTEVPKIHSDSNVLHINHESTIFRNPVENNNKMQISDSNLLINNNATLHPKIDDSEKVDAVAEAEIEDIKPQITSPQIPEGNTNSKNSSFDKVILKDNSNLEINANKSDHVPDNKNVGIVKEEHFENKTSSTVPLLSDTTIKTEINKTEIVVIPAQNRTEIYASINKDSDVIIINDSESEDETEKENRMVKNATDVQPSKESPLDYSDDVVIIESSPPEDTESILILDTDYEINESDETKCHLDITNKNATSECENHIPAEQEIKTSMEVKPALEDTSNKVKTDPSAEVKSEKMKIHHNKEQKDLPDVKVAEEINSKICDKPLSETPTEIKTDIPHKWSPKIDIADRVKTKSPIKINPIHNKNNESITRNNEESEVKVNRCLVNDMFVQKVESKLCFIWQQCTITDVIRHGKFSTVYLCKDSQNHEYALKIMKNQYGLQKEKHIKIGAQKEKMMIKLQKGVPENNLNCVRLIKGFVKNWTWCFLMEYYPGNMQEALAANQRSFHIDIVQILSRQLVSAVTILRNNNIVHSDIKPSHILINAAQTRIKLCGFDQSSYLEYSSLLPNTGTVNYRAPELILGYPAGYGIDVWSTALVMFEMATNQKLFPGFYNNNILYQQLCVLGCVPLDMLNNCAFRNAHYRGTAFSRIIGPGERIIIENFTLNGKIDRILYNTYATEWAPGRSQASKRNDKANIASFTELLHSMLTMHPRCRIAIEFVFANPFIYESFDDDC